MFGHMGGFGNGFFGPMYGRGFGLFPEILFLILIVVVVFLLLRRNRPNGYKNNNSDALELAKMRYVKGEISEEEYKKIVEVIKK